MQTQASPTPASGTSAAAVAQDLAAELRKRSVNADVLDLHDRSFVSMWHGLVACTDGNRIWWVAPKPSARGRELVTYAYHPDTAAVRLAQHYETARAMVPQIPASPFS